ncbi:MAG: methyl-accepting chemotaxis protein [Treponema sp.]|jgi:methyl-accepting chemotaxis protein|nr:methyl-accepting chemotaxis protein [Treponema sp.]
MKKVLGLRFKILLFFALFIAVLNSIVSVLSVRESLAVAAATLSNSADTLAGRASKRIDGDAFESLAKSLDVNDPYYKTTQAALLVMKEDSTALYLYTMVPARGNIYKYIIDGSGSIGSQTFSALGTEEHVAQNRKAFHRTWVTKAPQKDTLVYQEGWGYIVSAYTPILNSKGVMVGIVGCDFSAQKLYEMIHRQTIRQIILALVLSAAGVGVMGIFMRMIFGRLDHLSAILKEISEGEGDLTKRITIKQMDEIGNLATFFNLTLDKIRTMVMVIKNQSVQLSGIGNELAHNMSETAAGVNQITTNIESIKARVINQSASVTETKATMEQITEHIDKLGAHIEQQTDSVSQSSSAVEEMLVNIQSVTQTLTKNAKNVKELTESAEIGRSGLSEVAADIQEITRESEGLLEINAVMENIASQTNLLSMNAAIEAAHAGEAGKGFAVVADEIRKLAESSGEQSKTISTVLKKIKEAIDKISRSTGEVLGKFEAIDAGIKIVADQDGNIRSAMEEQGMGSRQILESIGKLQELTRLVKDGSIEMRNGSKEVISEGQKLEMETQEITSEMNEMALGAERINNAVSRVNDISGDNQEDIAALAQEVAKFKVE